VLLQLGDDLQDVREDSERSSATLFTRAAALSLPLDALVIQLLNLSERVAAGMDSLANASETLKSLLKMSWRTLIIGAVANSPQFFSPGFLAEAERLSPFRFGFLQKRQRRLAGRRGLYANLFDRFLEDNEAQRDELPLPSFQITSRLDAAA
jgi:hypothetical protein